MNADPSTGYYKGAPLSALPFASGRSRWSVPECHDYATAVEIGAVYARHFQAWLRENPHLSGGNALYVVMRDLAPTLGEGYRSAKKGYAIGFLLEIQRCLVARY